ncbi:MAG TPA: septum formation initiator family protein [Candidatus Eisenbacteria bacterium]|nr:septum formation initiator family protein [Candidatus Eisenbacteria bacterium]
MAAGKDKDVRDIGARIQRYRLSRYESPSGRPRRIAWMWPLLGLWAIYAGVLGEHSWFRIWRLGQESERIQRELSATRAELDRLEHQLHDAGARREIGEKVLRERNGFVGKGEILYRIPARDTLRD